MTFWCRLAALFFIVGVVLSPLRAVAATVPVLVGSVVHSASTATTTVRKPVLVRQSVEEVVQEAAVAPDHVCGAAFLAYDRALNLIGTDATDGDQGYEGSLELADRRELAKGPIYGAVAATTAAEGLEGAAGAAKTSFTVADRVAGQLADSRLGPLAGKITPEALQDLANNPNALKFLDTASGNTNIVQLSEGRLLRITTAADDASRIISVGPIQQNGLFNGIANGRFVPSIE